MRELFKTSNKVRMTESVVEVTTEIHWANGTLFLSYFAFRMAITLEYNG